MKVEVHHVITVEQEVELPDKCPKCEAALNKKGSLLRLYEYQDQGRTVSIEEDDIEDLSGCIEYPDLPDSGDDYILLSWHCYNCWCNNRYEPIVAAKEIKMVMETTPQSILDLLELKK